MNRHFKSGDRVVRNKSKSDSEIRELVESNGTNRRLIDMLLRGDVLTVAKDTRKASVNILELDDIAPFVNEDALQLYSSLEDEAEEI